MGFDRRFTRSWPAGRGAGAWRSRGLVLAFRGPILARRGGRRRSWSPPRASPARPPCRAHQPHCSRTSSRPCVTAISPRASTGAAARLRALGDAMNARDARPAGGARPGLGELRFWEALVDDMPGRVAQRRRRARRAAAQQGGAAIVRSRMTAFGRRISPSMATTFAERLAATRADRRRTSLIAATFPAAPARDRQCRRARAAGRAGPRRHGRACAGRARRGGDRDADRPRPRADARDPELAHPRHVARRHRCGAARRSGARPGRGAAGGADAGAARRRAAPLHRQLSRRRAPARATPPSLRRRAVRRRTGTPVRSRMVRAPACARHRAGSSDRCRSRSARAGADQPAAQRRAGDAAYGGRIGPLGIAQARAAARRSRSRTTAPAFPRRCAATSSCRSSRRAPRARASA